MDNLFVITQPRDPSKRQAWYAAGIDSLIANINNNASQFEKNLLNSEPDRETREVLAKVPTADAAQMDETRSEAERYSTHGELRGRYLGVL